MRLFALTLNNPEWTGQPEEIQPTSQAVAWNENWAGTASLRAEFSEVAADGQLHPNSRFRGFPFSELRNGLLIFQPRHPVGPKRQRFGPLLRAPAIHKNPLSVSRRHKRSNLA